MMLKAFAPAKVNLFLHVTGKRHDGYHLLDSLAVFPAVGDRVFAERATALSLKIGGVFGGALQTEPDNLMLRAAGLLKPGGKAALRLEKNLPVASGIGGGSADAAATLRVLARLWEMEVPEDAALQLGADVPVCLASKTLWMSGIGEILSAAPRLPEFGILLVNPGVAVPTPAVFKARMPGFSAAADLPDGWADAAAMADDLGRLNNDLQAAAIGLQPIIGEALKMLSALPGALLARMSGSGATCFALFATADAASDAARRIPYAAWWRWGGGLYERAAGDL